LNGEIVKVIVIPKDTQIFPSYIALVDIFVTKDIPSNVIAVGNPCKVVRGISDKQ